MKSNLVFSSLLSVSFLFMSCKGKEEEEASVTPGDTQKEIIIPRVQSIPTQNTAQQPMPQNVAVTPNQAVTANQTITPTQVTKAGMNPPHGQPGHRCDIAVGAPLNSPPGKTAAVPKAGTAVTQQITPGSFITTPAQTTQQAGTPAILDPNAPVTAPGMNPPHGQLGHQCGIAVGAPLPK